MPIIQYILPSKNKDLKKLLHFYWEVCPKHDENGKLKQEMILVCNAVRNDLQHPNEYIRGITLRLLQKLDDAELIEPLIPSCRQNLVSNMAQSLVSIDVHRVIGAPTLICEEKCCSRSHVDLSIFS